MSRNSMTYTVDNLVFSMKTHFYLSNEYKILLSESERSDSRHSGGLLSHAAAYSAAGAERGAVARLH